MNNKTDWDEYYHKKKSWLSTYTQKYTMNMILEYYIGCSANSQGAKILELGGGNSCFAKEFCAHTTISEYNIIDNNEYAVGLFNKFNLLTPHHGIVQNLLEDIIVEKKYAFVYSIGLIEHFTRDDRSKVIENHFKYCTDDGYVLISFPTPTIKYRFWRKVMEIFHVWQFNDETPLTLDDVREDLEKYGDIIKTEINNKLFLEQRLVLVRKRALDV